MLVVFRRHWPEYLMEAAGLALFMVSASVFGSLLESADSPVPQAIPNPLGRRVLMGLAMGCTAVCLIYSPWGQRSGAHINPATTLAFLRMGKVDPRDAAGYIAAQFLGGAAGVLIAWILLGRWLSAAPVSFVTTVPGERGVAVAFATELLLAFLMMTVVLAVSNSRHARWTGACAGILVAAFIIFLAPLSGMSINPARTIASALPAREYTAVWIYFVAPPLGMLLAVEARFRLKARRTACAKLDHDDRRPCLFCEWHVTQNTTRHRKHV
jgi:aquaporin Z